MMKFCNQCQSCDNHSPYFAKPIHINIMARYVLYLALLCLAEVNNSVEDPTGTRCRQIEGSPSCVCKTPTGETIDLTKLANSDGTPR